MAAISLKLIRYGRYARAREKGCGWWSPPLLSASHGGLPPPFQPMRSDTLLKLFHTCDVNMNTSPPQDRSVLVCSLLYPSTQSSKYFPWPPFCFAGEKLFGSRVSGWILSLCVYQLKSLGFPPLWSGEPPRFNLVTTFWKFIYISGSHFCSLVGDISTATWILGNISFMCQKTAACLVRLVNQVLKVSNKKSWFLQRRIFLRKLSNRERVNYGCQKKYCYVGVSYTNNLTPRKALVEVSNNFYIQLRSF